MSELKPCPFCGSTPQRGIQMEDGWHFIACYNGHEVVVGGETAEECLAAWNRRAGGWQPIETAPKEVTE